MLKDDYTLTRYKKN